jgi:hypothetical protein
MLLNAVVLNTLLVGGTLVSPVSMPVSASSAVASSDSSVIAYLVNTPSSQASSKADSLGSIRVEARLASSNTTAVTSSVGKLVVPVILTSYLPENLCQGSSYALNTGMLNSASTNSCVAPVYGSQAVSVSYGKLLVQAQLVGTPSSAISESSSAVLNASAYLEGSISYAVTTASDSKLIQRTLGLEECRMMIVPEYLHTMQVAKLSNTMMRVTCS